MKRFLVVFLVLVSLPVWAGEFGPLEPSAKEGKFSLGVGYFYEQLKWEAATLFEEKTEPFKTKSNQFYLQGSFGVTKGWEIFARVGVADAKLKEEYIDFKDGYKFFGTIGAKGVVYSTKGFNIGPFVQASLFSQYKDSLIEDQTKIDFKLKNRFDLNLGLLGQANINNNFFVYLGPFYAYNRTKLEVKVSELGVSVSDSDTVKAKAPIGGVIGLGGQIAKNLRFNAEAQIRNRISAGASLSYSF
ncbi:MAG: hypothetical protein RMJ39_10315 [Deltaproteobacteria bacterium]|nr:hypothetical protein [Deltaproteobacteria bacterium]